MKQPKKNPVTRAAVLAAFRATAEAQARALDLTVMDLANWLEYTVTKEDALTTAREMAKQKETRVNALTYTSGDYCQDGIELAREEPDEGVFHMEDVAEMGRKFDPEFALPLLRNEPRKGPKKVFTPVMVRYKKPPRKKHK